MRLLDISKLKNKGAGNVVAELEWGYQQEEENIDDTTNVVSWSNSVVSSSEKFIRITVYKLMGLLERITSNT